MLLQHAIINYDTNFYVSNQQKDSASKLVQL
jgi:hypothetical protein